MPRQSNFRKAPSKLKHKLLRSVPQTVQSPGYSLDTARMTAGQTPMTPQTPVVPEKNTTPCKVVTPVTRIKNILLAIMGVSRNLDKVKERVQQNSEDLNLLKFALSESASSSSNSNSDKRRKVPTIIRLSGMHFIRFFIKIVMFNCRETQGIFILYSVDWIYCAVKI